MHSSKSEKKTAQANVPETDSHDSFLGIGSRIAPAVALLMLSNSSTADATDLEDDTVTMPEPSAFALLAAGAIVGGAARYVSNKRRKK